MYLIVKFVADICLIFGLIWVGYKIVPPITNFVINSKIYKWATKHHLGEWSAYSIGICILAMGALTLVAVIVPQLLRGEITLSQLATDCVVGITGILGGPFVMRISEQFAEVLGFSTVTLKSQIMMTFMPFAFLITAAIMIIFRKRLVDSAA